MIKLLILDVDGVMTDGRKYYDRSGTVQLKTFCDKDWTAIKRFRAVGVEVCFVTGDAYNQTILENRNLDVWVNRGQGYHNDKQHLLPEILAKYNVTAAETAYVGDDIFDIGIMQCVKYPYCPSDSTDIVREHAQQLDCAGGDNLLAHLFTYLERRRLIPYVKFDVMINKVYELDIKEKF